MEAQAAQPYELTLRGFSPRELSERAKHLCSLHFGGAAFEVSECRCVPCVCSLGGRVRLYETRVVACPIGTPVAAG
jgi:hypothetical protein